jgi:hypothetical protein
LRLFLDAHDLKQVRTSATLGHDQVGIEAWGGIVDINIQVRRISPAVNGLRNADVARHPVGNWLKSLNRKS